MLGRVLPREIVREDEQKTDVVRDPVTGRGVVVTRKPYQLERTTAGNLTERQFDEIKRKRGIRR